VDHYAVLGVTTDATEKQLKTAYRMKSLKFHPDKKGGHTAAFQRIAEAYEVPASSPRLQLQLHFQLQFLPHCSLQQVQYFLLVILSSSV
jgi:hypothetical protein